MPSPPKFCRYPPRLALAACFAIYFFSVEAYPFLRSPARLDSIVGRRSAVLGASGLDLGLGSASANPAKVADALIGQPPVVSLDQLLRDITPRFNNSAALDKACTAIQKALPKCEYGGRLCSSANCSLASGAYYNTRQAGNRPACVIFPNAAKDVSTIMKLLRTYDVTYGVRSVAGHSTGFNFTSNQGFSSTTGVLIDMRKLTSVSFNAATGIARWETGLNAGDLALAMQKYGLQVSASRLGHIGAGCTLGGGLTWFMGQAGMGSDTNVAVEIVLPDGTLVTATRDNQYSDLFWAMKAGMNQFGIVTAIQSRTFPGNQFYGGSLLYTNDNLPALFEALVDWYGGRADQCSKGNVLVVLTNILVNSDLTRLNQVQIFYDGTNPGTCFDKFFAIPHILETTKVQAYADFITMSLTNIPIVFQGFNTALLSAATDIPTVKDLQQIYTAWNQYAIDTDGTYLQNSLSLTVMTNTTLAAQKAAGGTPMGVEDKGAFLWLVYDLTSIPAVGALTDPRFYAGAVNASKQIPQSRRSLPLYANYARVEQKPYLSYDPQALARFRSIKRKYDKEGFITTHTTGHVFQ